MERFPFKLIEKINIESVADFKKTKDIIEKESYSRKFIHDKFYKSM